MKKFCFNLKRVLSLLLIVSMIVTSAGATTFASAPTNYGNTSNTPKETQKETETQQETEVETEAETTKQEEVETIGEKENVNNNQNEEKSPEYAYVVELPEEYQELEFIESKNNAHIDTGVIGKSGVTTEMEVNLITSSSPAYVYGSRGDSGATRFLLARLSGKFDFAVKDDTKSSDWKLNTWHKLNLETTNSGTKLEVKDATGKLLNTKTTKNTYATNKSIWLFGTNTKSGNWSQVKMKQVKMFENGTLVRHFVPCYRIEDKVVGMFDVVNEEFYTNANSKKSGATFVAGPEIIREEDSEETKEAGEEDVPEELGEDETVDNTPDFGPLAETSSEVEETSSLDETTSGELGEDNNESSSVDKDSEVEEVVPNVEEATKSEAVDEGIPIDSKPLNSLSDGTILVELTPEMLAAAGITKDGPKRTIFFEDPRNMFLAYSSFNPENWMLGEIDGDGRVFYYRGSHYMPHSWKTGIVWTHWNTFIFCRGSGSYYRFYSPEDSKKYKFCLPKNNPEEVKAILSNHVVEYAERVIGLDDSFNTKIKYNLILPKGCSGLSLINKQPLNDFLEQYSNRRQYDERPRVSTKDMIQGELIVDGHPEVRNSGYDIEIEAIGDDGKVYKRERCDTITLDDSIDGSMFENDAIKYKNFNIYVIPFDYSITRDELMKDFKNKDIYSVSFIKDKNSLSTKAKKIRENDFYEVWEEEFRTMGNLGWINAKRIYYVLSANRRYYMPENCEGLFANMTELRSVNGLANVDMSKVKSMKSMFEGDISLKKVELPDNVKDPELYGKLEDVSCIFKDCRRLQDIGGTYFEYIPDHDVFNGYRYYTYGWKMHQVATYKKEPLIKGNSIKGINGNFFDQLYGLLDDDECIVKIDLGGASMAVGDAFPTTYVHKNGEVLELPVKRYTQDRQRFIVGYRDADKYTDAEWNKLSKKEIFTKIGKDQITDLNLKPVWYSERPYVKDLFISNKKFSDATANARGYKYVGMVNKGTKKHKTDIYLYYNTTYDPREAITSIRVHNSGKKRTESNPYSDHPYTPSHELLYFFYRKSPSEFNKNVKPYDLNEKSGGTFVYLFYAKNPMIGAPITAMELVDNRYVTTFQCSSDDEKTKTALRYDRRELVSFNPSYSAGSDRNHYEDIYVDSEYLRMDYARHEDRVIGDLNWEAGPGLFLVYSTIPRLSNEMLADNRIKNSIDSKHQNGYHWINGNRDYVDNTKQTVLMRNTFGTCPESKRIIVGSDLESVLPVLNNKKYEFVGWNVDDDMNNRISAFAVWKEDGTTTNKQSIKVRYVLPDNKYEEVDLTVGSKFKTIQSTDLRDFEGWYYNDNKVTEVTSDMPKSITLFAKFIDKFNIVVHNGYNNTVKKTLYGEEEYELPDASRDGYIFLGWYMDEELNAKITTLKDLTASKNNTIDIYGSWAIKEFAIKYNNIDDINITNANQVYVFDGEILKEKNSIVPFEGKYVSLQPMTNDGYDFKGWYYDKDFTKPLPTTEDIDKIDLLGYKYEYCLPALQQEKVVNIYAKLEETVCSITYDLVYNDVKFRSGYTPKATRRWFDTVELPLESDLTYDKSKYVFTGWTWRSKYKDGREFNFDNKGAINGRLNHVYDVTVKANFDVAYTITYNLSGGKWETGYTPVTKFGNTQEVIIPAYGKVVRNGYVLVGWKDKDDKNFGKTTEFRLSVMVPKGTNKNKEFTAVWRELYKYEMKYDLNGGSWATGFKPQTTITENETITLPKASNLTHKDGLAFDGWYVPNGSYPLTTYRPVGTEQKVVARWRAGKYISEIKMSVDADDQKAQNALINNGYTLVKVNLNLGTSGKNIYIGYKTTNDENNAIRGIGERWFNGDGRNPSTYKGSYHKYNYTAVTDLSGKQHSTNEGANDGSKWVYLYTTKDKNAGSPITNIEVVGNTVETPMNVLSQNNTYRVVVNSNDNGLADFNRGNKSPRRIYIRYQ